VRSGLALALLPGHVHDLVPVPWRRVLPRLTLVVALLPVAGCEHTAPFSPETYGSSQAFTIGSPRRLTYSAGQDLGPAWLPDESGIVYSQQRIERPDGDRCLAILPPDGGQLIRTICNTLPAADDSTDVYAEPAADSAGDLAYIEASSVIGAQAPLMTRLVLRSLTDSAAPPRAIVAYPYFVTGALPRDGAMQIRWLGSSTIVYVGLSIARERACKTCALDTVQTGVAIDRVDVRAPGAPPAVLSGTDYATSVAAGPTPDIIYYTLGGDSRVFRRTISSGADIVVYDFGFSGIARDVQVAGSRLVAVVGGRVGFVYDPLLGHPVQRDTGGPIHVVDLNAGTEAVLSAPVSSFRHPALSPSGKRLVAESGGTAPSDLWEFSLP